jgi:subtilase family protein
MADYSLRHILLSQTSTTEKYTSPLSPRYNPKLPTIDRAGHSSSLLNQLAAAESELLSLQILRDEAGIIEKNGITLLFEGAKGFDLMFESLDIRGSGIELLNVKWINETFIASVFVPDGKLKIFISRVEQYAVEQTRKGEPKNRKLVESINEIRKAAIENLWTDEESLFPPKEHSIWWEIWLRKAGSDEETFNRFGENSQLVELKTIKSYIGFPDRVVTLAFGSVDHMTNSLDLLNCFAELRKAKETPEFFMNQGIKEQLTWTDEALDRTRPADSDSISVCLLDTGVNQDHPLLIPHLKPSDLHSHETNWHTNDHCGHGTQMAGLAVYGDLATFLTSTDHLDVPYVLESVKILPPKGENEPPFYGVITASCISLPEIEAPYRKRIISMAVNTPDYRDRGKPSSWSAAVDAICSGANDENRRLMIISAGNVSLENCHYYPEYGELDGIHDPGQSWNALCVGAYTDKAFFDSNQYPGWKPIASIGGLSPSSTTSLTWDKQWPVKPDVVFEGGNCAINPINGNADYIDDLQLLSTSHQHFNRLFEITGDTSAATAQVAGMAAYIQSEYQEFTPETVRALLVHSAEWTSTMKARWPEGANKSGIKNRIRSCGFGVPNLSKALKSARNDLTLIIQDELHPYDKVNGQPVTRDIHVHEIPWPKEILEQMFDASVEMRVTLSYFVEPNPGQRGWKKRYRYASHQLRFDTIRRGETLDSFRKRKNKAARNGESFADETDSNGWVIGAQERTKGSLHSDTWRGSAIDLAEKNYICIYPITGWWKERHQMGNWDKKARYSLIVSISAPEIDVDLYVEIANQIGIEIEV